MPFVIEGAPARIMSCEMHNKQAKKADAEMGKAPSREKKIVVELDLSHADFMSVLDEKFPGVDLMAKRMSGTDAAAMQVVASKKLGDVAIECTYVDDARSEVFKIDVAKPTMKPTLRITKKAEKILMTIVVVGSLPKAILQRIDDALGADVAVNVREVQAEFDFDDPDGSKKKARGKKSKTTLALVDPAAQESLV
jgi:hypothetical protein